MAKRLKSVVIRLVSADNHKVIIERGEATEPEESKNASRHRNKTNDSLLAKLLKEKENPRKAAPLTTDVTTYVN